MTVPMEAFANLQSDFGADDCRDSFIKYLRIHEGQIDPNTPLSNYISSENSAVKTVVKLQALAPLKEYRMPIARSLLSMLFGNDASWEALKLAWMHSELYPTLFENEQCPAWLWRITLVISIGITLCYCWNMPLKGALS